MTSLDLYTVRPTRTNLPLLGSGYHPLEGAFRAFLSASDLSTLSLKLGDYFWVRQSAATSDGEIRTGIVVAARSADSDMNGNARVVKLTDVARKFYGMSPKTKVLIMPLVGAMSTAQVGLPRAAKVVLRPQDDSGQPLSALPPGQAWDARALSVLLDKHDVITKNTYFPVIIRHGPDRGRKLNFVVEEVVGHESDIAKASRTPNSVPTTVQGDPVFEVDSEMVITFSTPGRASQPSAISSSNRPNPFSSSISSPQIPPQGSPPIQTATFTQIGGLDKQIKSILQHLGLDQPFVSSHELASSLKRRRLLIFGAPANGKSKVLSAIGCHSVWKAVKTVSDMSGSTKAITQLQKLFEEALANTPSVVMIPRLDYLGTRGEVTSSDSITMAAELYRWMDRVSNAAVSIIATARIPNDVCSVLRPHFSVEIELPIPNINSRKDIINVLLNRVNLEWDRPERFPSSSAIQELAEFVTSKTHGYVGGDLEFVVDEAIYRSRLRCCEERQQKQNLPTANLLQPTIKSITVEDFMAAVKQVKPSALKEILVETPKVLWSDIGGCTAVKKQLREATTKRFESKELLAHLSITPPRGILLYGPPGCSKTLVAKGAATESGYNFIAVKGAELTSMYVGETERAVREVFRKARAAAPTIVFFDEIDSIASNRFSPSGGKSGSAHPGLSVVTTLLNEMDGIQPLNDGVLVLAATNRPDSLDDALLRPGRFSKLVYLGPPDEEARKKILEVRTRNVPLGPDVDLDELAKLLDGYTGAEVVEVVNEACLQTADEFGDDDSDQQVSDLNDALSTLSVVQDEVVGIPALSKKIEDVKVLSKHFAGALEVVFPAVQPSMLKYYEDWGKQRQGKLI